MLWYDIVQDEKSLLKGYTSDIRDNVLICKFQCRFSAICFGYSYRPRNNLTATILSYCYQIVSC
jgi:hypothetical protein